MRIVVAIMLSACVAAQAFGQSMEYNGELSRARGTPPTDQIIVKWRTGAAISSAPLAASKMRKLASASGMQLQRKHVISAETDVLKLDRPLEGDELGAVLEQIASDPDVEFAVADQRRWAHAIPSDPLISQQWYFLGAQPAATRAEQAWDVTIGSNTTIVAVLDTGVRFEHPDLGRVAQGGKVLPGFDFVSDFRVANDGDGRDNDPSDPGDWVSAADTQEPPFSGNGCIPPDRDHVDSSWHGTRVSSLIAALTNDAIGMAGTGWDTLLLPVRVLGKCGGNDSDIIAAMRWAAGLTVPGVPTNGNPAKIINLSLGGNGTCSAAYQLAVTEITARGTLIVASVGNDGGPVGPPANCNGVLGVTGLRHAGTKVGFSNLGPGADIGAPAGNCVTVGPDEPCQFSIIVATNTGTMEPANSTYTNQFAFNVGTSFSAPLVAGAAALIHSLNAQLSPSQYVTLLQESAAPFPASSTTSTTACRVPANANDIQNRECVCTRQTCGAGMLDTHAAVLAAQRPFAIAEAPTIIDPGTDVAIDANSSLASNGRSLTSYQWSAVNVIGATPTFADASQPATTLQVSGTSQFTLRLTVTDDQSAQDIAEVAIATPPPPTLPPASGGGGGNIGALLLAMYAFARLRKRREGVTTKNA